MLYKAASFKLARSTFYPQSTYLGAYKVPSYLKIRMAAFVISAYRYKNTYTEMTFSGVIFIPSFIKISIGSDVVRWARHRHMVE